MQSSSCNQRSPEQKLNPEYKGSSRFSESGHAWEFSQVTEHDHLLQSPAVPHRDTWHIPETLFKTITFSYPCIISSQKIIDHEPESILMKLDIVLKSCQELAKYSPQASDDILTSACISIQILFTFDMFLGSWVCSTQCGCIDSLQLRVFIQIAVKTPFEK